MNVVGIIPARMAASRFPGKPLARIAGMAMLEHVYRRSCLSEQLNAVYIATCDEEIRAYADGIGAPCVMTADTHQRASDRAAEAADHIESATGRPIDVVMMIQGDEPLLRPEMLDQAVEPLLSDVDLPICNLIAEITTEEDFESPNLVKVVVDRRGNALYLSREPIPSRSKASGMIPRYKQLGLIAFRRDYLARFYALAPTPLEVAESVDMLRVLEHGDRLRTVVTEDVSMGVDTPEDLARVEGMMAGDPLFARYFDGAEA
jgi:3-deoxy-manno-octulosonate cytidylyltransferase (CMP-KDO synthetase)